MYKKLVNMIIETTNENDILKASAAVDRAFDDNKISPKDMEQLHKLVNKVYALFV